MNSIYWIHGPKHAPRTSASRMHVPLAIVLCPRGGRYLDDEMFEYRRAGIDTLVSLLSEEQVMMLELGNEGSRAKHMGMRFLHHPIPDHQLPRDVSAFREFVSDLAERVRRGERIGIHCWGSIGRATLTAACTLVHLGWTPGSALAAVEMARGCPVPDTEEQERWILNYKAQA